MERQLNLLLSVPLRNWQDFQNTLAHSTGMAMCLFGADGSPFSSFSQPPEGCLSTLQGGEVWKPSCLEFYKGLFGSLQNKACLTSCLYGCKLFVFQISTYVQRVGYLVIAFPPRLDVQKQNVAFEAKARYIYRVISEVLVSLIEKCLLGLRRLELNSIYEISRLLVSTIELDRVLGLITDSTVILYEVELCFLGLRKGDKVEVIQVRGPWLTLFLEVSGCLPKNFLKEFSQRLSCLVFLVKSLQLFWIRRLGTSRMG
ncbi:MAG: PocR ligand-binding domain-containing protein [Candidatus Caldatribacteriaceae bacterium]